MKDVMFVVYLCLLTLCGVFFIGMVSRIVLVPENSPISAKRIMAWIRISIRSFALLAGFGLSLSLILALSMVVENAGQASLSNLLVEVSFLPVALFCAFIYWAFHKIVPDVPIERSEEPTVG